MASARRLLQVGWVSVSMAADAVDRGRFGTATGWRRWSGDGSRAWDDGYCRVSRPARRRRGTRRRAGSCRRSPVSVSTACALDAVRRSGPECARRPAARRERVVAAPARAATPPAAERCRTRRARRTTSRSPPRRGREHGMEPVGDALERGGVRDGHAVTFGEPHRRRRLAPVGGRPRRRAPAVDEVDEQRHRHLVNLDHLHSPRASSCCGSSTGTRSSSRAR